MELILNFQDILVRNIANNFRRSLHDQINWDKRMIGIKRPRRSRQNYVVIATSKI